MKMAGSNPSQDWLLLGMDPKSTYLLEICIAHNSRSRKDVSCLIDTMVVDADTCNFKDFVNEIVEKNPPRYNENVIVAHYDHSSAIYMEVKSDQDILEMFAKHVDTKVVDMSIAYTLPSETPQWPIVSTKSIDIQCTEATTSQPIQPSICQLDDDNYLLNPEPENEFVGVDEEALYLSNASKTGVSHEDDTSKSESESDSDEDYDEEDGLVGKDPTPPAIVSYDKEDPPMVVGSTYPDWATFKLALSQHAIKHEFEYDTEKSDRRRLRVCCSRKVEEGCRWRLHASTMDDEVTVKVKRNPHAHSCTSVRRSKEVKNATKFWVCDVVKDWLIEDPRQGPKDLKAKIKSKYKVDVPYKRVFVGKELAQKQLFGEWDNSFDNLFRFKAKVEKCRPGSVVVINHHTIQDKVRFNRMFFAMKPCIDGFLKGCMPYLSIDSTFLTEKFKG
ncbi:hypothetical protein U9M48_019814 [Paspalum notatum var. saurae]|uniref:Transposase MuDR plant domain-containing protein n=1 Tax=Paspalum notatum var. saurae TaxID=547442 RepID=A0AAQ3TGA3_PASNO